MFIYGTLPNIVFCLFTEFQGLNLASLTKFTPLEVLLQLLKKYLRKFAMKSNVKLIPYLEHQWHTISVLSCTQQCFILSRAEKATLIFSVECLQLTKASMFSITDEQKQLLMYTGIFVVALLFVYEMYQRAIKTEPKKKSTREHPNRKKGKKS